MSPFDQFQETPRPYLDSDTLKAKFLKFSAPLHPDRVHHLSEKEKKEATHRFSELNAAYLILREPQDRLNFLIELETGSKPSDIQKIPPGTMELFMEVGQICRDFDVYFSSRQSSETSSLLKVTAICQRQQWLTKLQEIQVKIRVKNQDALNELQELDRQWISTSDRKPLLKGLENLARLFSYLARWSQQLDERLIQLKSVL